LAWRLIVVTHGRPSAAGRKLGQPSWVRWWALACPICYGPVPGDLLADQVWRLARHMGTDHPYEAALLAIMLSAEPGVDDGQLDQGRARD
jgi:hypothetical protein